MFYTTDTNQHGLSHDPFKAIVAPRPIGWIGSKGRDGSINLSPYSFFNAVSDRPKLVMFSSTGRKDSACNVEETGVFTANLVSRNLVEKMNHSSISVPYGTNEFALAGLTAEPGRLVDAPYVGEALCRPRMPGNGDHATQGPQRRADGQRHGFRPGRRHPYR